MCHGRDAGVLGAARYATDPGAVREPGCRAERTRRAVEQAARSGRPARACVEPVVDLDGELHTAVALQLDAAVFSARRRSGAELGRNGPPDFQPELYRCR